MNTIEVTKWLLVIGYGLATWFMGWKMGIEKQLRENKQ